MCDFTALLVLETESDYARFHIDRRALTDILGVGMDGIEVRSRKSAGSRRFRRHHHHHRNPSWMSRPMPKPGTTERNPWTRGHGGRIRSFQWHRWRTNVPLLQTRRQMVPCCRCRRQHRGRCKWGTCADRGGGSRRHPRRPCVKPSFKDDAADGMIGVRAAHRLRLPLRHHHHRDQSLALIAPKKPRKKNVHGPSRSSVERWPCVSSASSVLRPVNQEDDASRRPFVNPYEGKLADVMNLLKAGRAGEALQLGHRRGATAIRGCAGLIGLGEVFESAAAALGGSCLRFDHRSVPRSRRSASLWAPRLEKLSEGLDLAADTYAKAAVNRPRSSVEPSHAGLRAISLGKPAEAFEAIVSGAARAIRRVVLPACRVWPKTWDLSQQRGCAKNHSVGKRSNGGCKGLGAQRGRSVAALCAVMETDANDVDFHILDGRGGHAYFSNPSLPSGGELYADVTTGYGPECFSIFAPSGQRAYPYKLQAHYYSRGPMGCNIGQGYKSSSTTAKAVCGSPSARL